MSEGPSKEFDSGLACDAAFVPNPKTDRAIVSMFCDKSMKATRLECKSAQVIYQAFQQFSDAVDKFGSKNLRDQYEENKQVDAALDALDAQKYLEHVDAKKKRIEEQKQRKALKAERKVLRVERKAQRKAERKAKRAEKKARRAAKKAAKQAGEAKK